jgi:hypothetical protein
LNLLVTAAAPFALGAAFAWSPIARADEAASDRPSKESALGRIDGEMSRTGDIGVVELGATNKGNGIETAGRLAERPENKVTRIEPPPSPPAAVMSIPLPDDVALSHQYEGAFAAVDNCRFDVARRRLVPPGEIRVGTVTFHWRIDPTGHVHDMRAEVVTPTDKDVVKCGERVLANWALLNPVEKPVVLERTYVFRRLTSADKGPLRVGAKD